MSRAAALLLLTSALLAQAPDGSAAPAAVTSISLRVDLPERSAAVEGLTPEQVSADLIGLFIRNGIPVLPEAEVAGAPGAQLLEVSPLTLHYAEGTCLVSVSERLLRLAEAPGQGAPRTLGANHMFAQAGEAELLFQTREIILGMAAQLVQQARGQGGPPLTPQPLAPAALGEPAPWPAAERPVPRDLDFSRIRVRHRPPAPAYPGAAREQHVQGTLVVQITMDPEGRPTRAVALGGPPLLKPTALRYAMQWLFEPALLEGRPQWARFNLTMPFRLREAPSQGGTYGTGQQRRLP